MPVVMVRVAIVGGACPCHAFFFGARLPARLKLHRYMEYPHVRKLLADLGLDGLRHPLRHGMERGISAPPIQRPEMDMMNVNNAINLHNA